MVANRASMVAARRRSTRLLAMAWTCASLAACTSAAVGPKDATASDAAQLDAATIEDVGADGGAIDLGAPDSAAIDLGTDEPDGGSVCSSTQRCVRADGTSTPVACLESSTASCVVDGLGLRHDWCGCGLPAMFFDPPSGESRGAPLRNIIVVTTEGGPALEIGGDCRGGTDSTGCSISDPSCSDGAYVWTWNVSELRYTSEVAVRVLVRADAMCFGGDIVENATWRP